MPLENGARLGHYVISGALGAGGMGEVYRARDTKLDRDVAIKVLPQLLAGDPERRSRFEREARLLASLNHPHIGAIHGIEHSGEAPALILELVEGETIADHLRAGPMPVDMAVRAATEIALALDAAHERGIVHRDLKPANIKITPDGSVKVLDFGLAKALAPDPDSSADRLIAESPTVTVAGTREGIILGTAAYMSPEQARGRGIDKRTDVWAFGCVLYEMLTGRRAFEGETVSDTIAAILTREPDWTRLPAATPSGVRRALARCLEKDRKRRLRDVGDLSLDLNAPEIAPTSASGSRWRLATAGAALMALVALAFAGWRGARPESFAGNPARFSIAAPPDYSVMFATLAVSPDGSRIVFGAESGSGERAFWLRRLDSEALQKIAGTEGLQEGRPTWSPDGRSLAFHAGEHLKRVDLESGAVQTIASMNTNMGVTWNSENTIVFGWTNRAPLRRILLGGGATQDVTTLDTSRENSHRWPQFLPDGKHFLFTARSDVRENNLIRVGSLDSTETRPIRSAQSNAVYVSSGHLLFAEEGTLMAQLFDARTLTLSGDAVPILTNVSHGTTGSTAGFAASADGRVIAHIPETRRVSRLLWFDRDGTPLGSVGDEREFMQIRLSPDAKKAATVIPDPVGGNRDIWLVDLSTGTLDRLTSHGANDWWPTWSPDGSTIAFSTDRDGTSSLYQKPSTGGEETFVARAEGGLFLRDWSQDGDILLAGLDPPAPALIDLVTVVLADKQIKPLVVSAARDGGGAFSPSRRWVAYDSNQAGTQEIYLRAFDGTEARRVSKNGGRNPTWGLDGELFFLAPNDDVMTVTVTDAMATGDPRRLFHACGDGPDAGRLASDQGVAVTKTGDRFLMICAPADTLSTTISVTLNPILPSK